MTFVDVKRLQWLERRLDEISEDMNLLLYEQRALIGEAERLRRELHPERFQ